MRSSGADNVCVESVRCAMCAMCAVCECVCSWGWVPRVVVTVVVFVGCSGAMVAGWGAPNPTPLMCSRRVIQ